MQIEISEKSQRSIEDLARLARDKKVTEDQQKQLFSMILSEAVVQFANEQDMSNENRTEMESVRAAFNERLRAFFELSLASGHTGSSVNTLVKYLQNNEVGVGQNDKRGVAAD